MPRICAVLRYTTFFDARGVFIPPQTKSPHTAFLIARVWACLTPLSGVWRDNEAKNEKFDFQILDGKQVAGLLGVEYKSLRQFIYRSFYRNVDKLSTREGKSPKYKSYDFITYRQFVTTCYGMTSQQYAMEILDELDDALAVYMTDAPTYERVNAVLTRNAYLESENARLQYELDDKRYRLYLADRAQTNVIPEEERSISRMWYHPQNNPRY